MVFPARHERAVPDRSGAVADVGQDEFPAPGECAVSDRDQRLGQVGPLQETAALERIVADLHDSFRYADSLEPHIPAETAVAYPRHFPAVELRRNDKSQDFLYDLSARNR